MNGLAVGGAVEALLNCDMVVAAPHATLALPDLKVGLTLLGGTLARLVRTVGRGRAADMIFTGRAVGAAEALSWGLVQRVVEGDPVKEAVGIAAGIVGLSPDAVGVTRRGLLMVTRTEGEDGRRFVEELGVGLRERGNTEEGIRAFLERRRPRYVRGKL